MKQLFSVVICFLVVGLVIALVSFSSQATVEAAYKEGFEAGYEEGYEKGYTALKPVEMPKTGEVLSGKKFAGDRCSLLTVCTGNSACVVSVKNSKGIEQTTFFVRPNSTAKVSVPKMKLYVYFASGDEWYGYGEGLMFGDDTYYSKDDDLLDFSNYSYEYTLYSVYDGNFSETPSDQSEFFN